MSKYSCFISEKAYEDYYNPESEHAQKESNLGVADEADQQGDRWVCGMPSEEADEFIAEHTNKDGTLDYDGMGKDLGFTEDQTEALKENGVYRVDYEANGSMESGDIRNTVKNGPNDNGNCKGNGVLPDGKSSDHECKNVPRENITNAYEVKGAENHGQEPPPPPNGGNGEKPRELEELNDIKSTDQQLAKPDETSINDIKSIDQDTSAIAESGSDGVTDALSSAIEPY